MYSLVDKLIFPAPKPAYSSESLKGRLIYIPKFKDYFQNGDNATIGVMKGEDSERCNLNLKYTD